MLGGLTVWGQRSVEHLSKKAYTTTSATAETDTDEMGADTAASSGSSDDDAWRSIPQEPRSFYMGSFSAAKHRVAHAVEPLDCPGLHITVTLRTDIFDTGRSGAAHEPTTASVNDPLLRGIVNMALACFVSERPPRVPSLTDATKLISAAVK